MKKYVENINKYLRVENMKKCVGSMERYRMVPSSPSPSISPLRLERTPSSPIYVQPVYVKKAKINKAEWDMKHVSLSGL